MFRADGLRPYNFHQRQRGDMETMILMKMKTTEEDGGRCRGVQVGGQKTKKGGVCHHPRRRPAVVVTATLLR
ncbi:hypothetical protein Hanom_Chr04g00332181 [Helianthus anomalus]